MDLLNYLDALLGGILIGASALLLILAIGRIAGISGIASNIIAIDSSGDKSWRIVFLLGLIIGALIYHLLVGLTIPFREPPAPLMLVIAGLLVGFGTHQANGCTSGHGVCGIGRFSVRSITATVTFMLSAAITVFIVRHVIGG